ncbi:MAG: ankyrin repeat domain-containing protein [Lentisphaeria bacterium]|nr:ankyrin repeat domain-containing protein [Lentisphaeria bacterium]
MNSKFRNILSGGLLAVLAGFIPHETFGCAPYFQPHYINGRSPYPTVLHRKLAVRRLITDLDDLIPKGPSFPDGATWKTSIQEDFTAAVNLYLPKLAPEGKQKLIRDYLKFMQDRRKNLTEIMKDFPELPPELEEFTLYRAGVAEMKPDGREVPPSWKKLLELPREKRKFRTVWIYFMLGNYLKHDCGKYYQACRAAAREGFADTPGLAKASYRNEFRYTTNRIRKIHVALEAQRNSPDLELLADDYSSIMPVSDEECLRMLADPLCRELLAIFGCKKKVFLDEVWKYKFRNADVLAWRAYEAGEVETAEKYLKLRTRDTLLSTYIESKIARYHGNNELAIQKLRQWLKAAEKIDPRDRADIVEIKHVMFDPFNTEPTYPLRQDVYGLLGSALVLRRDFSEAAMYFYRAGQIEADVMYIAECLMNLTELTALADSIADDLKSKNEETRRNAESIRHLTARRAFREGKFDIARKYLPEEYKGVLDLYLAFIRGGNDLGKSSNERALCFYNAAKILRWYGMELSGTNGAPDDFYHRGGYGIEADFEDCPNCKYDQKTDQWTHICRKHWELYSSINDEDPFYQEGERQPVPRNQRFHYRYRAAELAEKAAEMAQDADLRALANLFAGECLRIRTPRKADVFYKRLVRNSPYTAIAKIADKLRWFPNCPALRNEFDSIVPCKSLEEVKTLMQQTVLEMNEIMKKKAEEQQKQVQRKLFDVVKKNDLKAAESLLKSGADVNAPDDKGLVPLHYAAVCQHVEMVKYLLSHGADVNKKNKWSWTPLHYALGSDQETDKLCPKPNRERTMAVVKLLVEAKANINAEDDHDLSPVYLALDDLEILKYLWEHGGCVDVGSAYRWKTPLHWAIIYDCPLEVIDFILKHGGKINESDGDGNAPLHYAVQNKNLKIVKCLVEHGANINLARDIDECETPLDLAEEAERPEIVKYLKAHGAVRGKFASGKAAP